MADFSGQTVVCIGSGPSLTEADCKLVEKSGLPTIAVNSSWQRARFAKVIYAGDYEWWRVNKASIDIDAELWTCQHSAYRVFDINLHRVNGSQWHSGLRAIQFAELAQAERVILLGYDCSVKKGVHWHGAHEKTANPTDKRCIEWKAQYKRLAASTKIDIINCSRETALTAFPLANLEDTLCLKLFPAVQHLKTNSN
jgi:hypothetical protein